MTPGFLGLEIETDVGVQFGVASTQEGTDTLGRWLVGREVGAGPGEERLHRAPQLSTSPVLTLFSFDHHGREVVILFGATGKINHGFVEGGYDLGGRFVS